MLRIIELEDQLHTLEKNQQSQIESDTLLIETDNFKSATNSFEKYRSFFFDFAKFFVLPLLLLVLAHVCITIIYDTKIIYLRIVTFILPLFFGYFLYHKQSRNTLVWLICVLTLGWVSVACMSTVTSHVDDSPVWPQTIYVWRDLINFSASISFSYLTGMLLGRISFLKSNSTITTTSITSDTTGGLFLEKNEERVSSTTLQIIAKKLNELITTIGAIVTTIIAIYTGLKGLL
jgi:hypothetical protein